MKRNVISGSNNARIWGVLSGMCENLNAYARLGLFLLLFAWLPVRVAAVGFTPTEGGLYVNLQYGDRILLSVMIDDDNNPATPDVEYFVCHYPGYTGGHFGYTNWDDKGSGNILKLIPQDAGATEPASPSIWTIDEPVPFRVSGKTYPLDGIAYTMWSTNPGGDSYTLVCSPSSAFKYQGYLTREADHANICNAVFIVPTDRGDKVTSFDPNNTMGRGTKFNGEKGYGFLGLPYREVYWLDIPRGNSNPVAYLNASVVSFNTTTSNYKYSNNAETAKPGQAMYAFADNKHKPTMRTIFRLYVLDDTMTSSCPDGYFFAYDEQDSVRYVTDFVKTPDTYTTWRKIYTIDHLKCMDSIPGTKYWQTDYMYVPDKDNLYYYVGYKNKYCHTDRDDAFNSQFKNIDSLRIQHLGITAPRGAFGRLIVDTTQTAKQNLGVSFKPAGYFLRTSSGRNIRMRQTGDDEWTCEEMWHITAAYAALQIKATMFTGTEYSDTDTGMDIPGWSVMVTGTDVPLADGSGNVHGGLNGWARIHTDSTDPNGHMEFVLANGTRHIHYDYNGFFGTQIPDQYPMANETSVTVEEPRLAGGFDFAGWTTNADGTGTTYQPGDVINLPEGELTLYAQATYTGTIHVALSFLQNGERYFLTHPGVAAPRYSRARRVTDWTDTYQGMANAENVEPNYINTFKLLTYPDPCTKCAADEVVLDPRREKQYGAIDSLVFYENFSPTDEEYPGLYYTDPNVILANTTWAGLFKSTATGGRNGWPDFSVADVQNAKLSSTHYLGRDGGGNIERRERPNSSASWIRYNAAENQFEGDASEANATVFQIARVRVADEHFVIIPDTIDAESPWTDEITFGYHDGVETGEWVWSKLIGKQLMAVTKVGDDTVYFHPNPDKTLTTANRLRTSLDYRLIQTFTYIRDARVESLGTVAAGDKPKMNEALDDFSRIVTSGMNSPRNVQYQGNYIDIVDTLRVTLRPMAGKIKDYYGRWKTGAPGLHVNPDGSRYRDILVTTKTYHYGAMSTRLILTSEFRNYNFNPLADQSKTINFTLAMATVRQLLDADGNPIGEEEIVSTEDITSNLALGPGACRFTSNGAYFAVNNEQTVGQHITLYTKAENQTESEHFDTLIVTTSVTIDAVAYPVTVRVPLVQTTSSADELIWSAVADGQRYYIMANSSGLLFHQYTEKNGTLYKKGTSVQLTVGEASSAIDDRITPWKFAYAGQIDQLTLWTEYGVDKDFAISGSTAVASSTSPSVLTYRYVDIHRNDNNNEEELIRLKYGPNKWLKFQVVDNVPSIVLQDDSASATVFSWTYLDREYNLQNDGTYPDADFAEFYYNSNSPAEILTKYKAWRDYTMMVDNKVVHLCREEEKNMANLIDDSGYWLTDYSITHIPDARAFDGGARLSGLTVTLDSATLKTTVTPVGASPVDVSIGGRYVNIVDTLDVQISLQEDAPEYRFAGDWSGYESVRDAHLKLPLIRRTYHSVAYDSLICRLDGHESYNHAFPAHIVENTNDEYTFIINTERHTGTHVLSVDNEPVAIIDPVTTDVTESGGMDLTNAALAEVRLVDVYGDTPAWCRIEGMTENTITVKALQNGVRSPRVAYIYVAYIVTLGGRQRFVSQRLSVSQVSIFDYANNQRLQHSKGASGDELLPNGMQQVHENRQILYYYNPSNINRSPDQDVELPVRERAFYGWWRWFRESDDPEIGDSDIPDSLWVNPPRNVGRYNIAFRVIGDSVWVDEEDPSQGRKLVTMGRYTVFHHPSKDYGNKNDPPSKSPLVCPPVNKDTVTYVAEISNYYDNMPLTMTEQVDTKKLDTMRVITEPTLSLREIFELHPWTEMAERMEGYKDTIASGHRNLRYMEDHVMMAPTGSRLLLNTEQRYNLANLQNHGHSESLLGYYMRDDNWSTGGWDDARKDTMIWCGGWDADCKWYTYNPADKTYTECTHPVMAETDFLQVPALSNITPGHEFDTVYYCLRARSQKTLEDVAGNDSTVDGDYWFNICRYTLIYHNPAKYGPKLETSGKALITNDDIEQHYDVLERLNFDYNKPGSEYTIYPHPLPWADASYGYNYPLLPGLPQNRYTTRRTSPTTVSTDSSTAFRTPPTGEKWSSTEVPRTAI